LELKDRANELEGALIGFTWLAQRPDDWELGGPYLSIIYN